MFFKRKKIPIEEKLMQEAKPLLERIMQYVDYDTKNVDKIYAFCSNEYDNVFFHPYFVINNCYLKTHTVNQCSNNEYDVSKEAQLSLLDRGKKICKEIFKIFDEYKQEMPTQIIIEYDVKKEKFNTKIDYELHWSNDDEKLPSDVANEWFENLKKNNEV